MKTRLHLVFRKDLLILQLKLSFIKKPEAYMLIPSFSNILTLSLDSIACFSFTETKLRNNERDIQKALLFTGSYQPQADTATITYARPGSELVKSNLFPRNKIDSAANFSWSGFLNGNQPQVKQKAVIKNEITNVKIDTSMYQCLHVVYMRDTTVRNQLPIKIKGKSWNAKGYHKETIVTHVYLRNTDYIPVRIVELMRNRMAKTNNYADWEIENLWLLNKRIE